MLAGFGLLPVRSPLLGEYFSPNGELVSFPPGTEMFHFPGCAAPTQGRGSSRFTR